jgi:hypothetical protein
VAARGCLYSWNYATTRETWRGGRRLLISRLLGSHGHAGRRYARPDARLRPPLLGELWLLPLGDAGRATGPGHGRKIAKRVDQNGTGRGELPVATSDDAMQMHLQAYILPAVAGVSGWLVATIFCSRGRAGEGWDGVPHAAFFVLRRRCRLTWSLSSSLIQ